MSTEKLIIFLLLLVFSAAGLYYELFGFRWLWLLPVAAAIVLLLPYLAAMLLLIFDRETPVQKIDRIHKKWRQDNPDR